MKFCFSSRRRHTRCALVTGVQTCALPILEPSSSSRNVHGLPHRRRVGHLAPHDPAHRILLPVARSARELGAIRATDSAISTYAIPYQNPQKTATTVDPMALVCYENVARRRELGSASCRERGCPIV